MAEKLYEIFTHIDVLKSREPEYCICKEPVIVDLNETTNNRDFSQPKKAEDTEKASMDSGIEPRQVATTAAEAIVSTTGTTAPSAKTFVSILEEGCKKYYDGAPPIFALDLTEITDLFVIRCELYGTYTLGRGRTKKVAKQMAAKAMLQKLVEKESFREFGLGKTKEEALASLESLLADFQKPGDVDGPIVENWVGKVNERCQKLKLQNAVYEIDEEGPPNQRIFLATCKIGKAETTARGKTKKIAKTLAAQEMYSNLENWKDLGEDLGSAVFNTTEQEAVNKNNHPEPTTKIEENTDLLDTTIKHPESLKKIHAAFGSGFGAQGLTANLRELIKSGDENINKVFLDQELKFVFLASNVHGDIQCMLSIDGPNGMKNVFCGFGNTEADAKDHAARNALTHLELFVRSSEPSKGPGVSSDPDQDDFSTKTKNPSPGKQSSPSQEKQ